MYAGAKDRWCRGEMNCLRWLRREGPGAAEGGFAMGRLGLSQGTGGAGAAERLNPGGGAPWAESPETTSYVMEISVDPERMAQGRSGTLKREWAVEGQTLRLCAAQGNPWVAERLRRPRLKVGPR